MDATRRTRLLRVGMMLAASALALPALAGTASAAPSPPDFRTECERLAAEFRGVLENISSLSENFPDLPSPELTAQFTALQTRADDLNRQLSSQFCSSLPGSSGGSSSVSSAPGYDDGTFYPSTYGSGHRYYDTYDTSAPVVATQVDAVPRGGVATGDGSFAE